MTDSSRINNGSVIWITGLSDSGKTTLAGLLAEKLRRNGKSIILLDGDQLREVFGVNKHYSRESRLRLAYRYSSLCKMLASQGQMVIIATIALFKEIHEWNRRQLPGYYEVYLKTPMEELRRRDSKGIYRRYDAGELDNVYGLDLKYDEPEHPEYLVQFDSKKTPDEIADHLANLLISMV